MTRFSRFALSILFVFAFFTVTVFAQNNEGWRPIIQAELDMKTPQVETDADAEAIFWEVSLDDKKRKKLFYNHYVRVKIFTERGREKFSKVDIPFTKGKTVEEVAARVIKPDGTIIELKAAEVFERRYFGGFENQEVAAALDLTEVAATRQWNFARAWLKRALTGKTGKEDAQ